MTKKINWMNAIFLLGSPIIAIVGVSWVIWRGDLHWATLVLTVAMAIFTGISITGGYHRLFSHRSYKAHWMIRLFYLIFGSASLQNSACEWCSDHRDHHRHVDKEGDPYNINKGFFYAHMGWILFEEDKGDHSYQNIPDLTDDPLVMWQHRYYLPLSISVAFFLPTAIASLWGDPWGGLFLAGMARVVFNHHWTFAINSFCHFIGKQTYSDSNSARDSWVISLFTYGEGFHNFHHKFQSDYRNGVRSYHFDPTKWFIHVLSWIGLARDLRRTNEKAILKARLRMDEIRLANRLEKFPKLSRFLSEEVLEAARVKIEHASTRIYELKDEYRQLKREKVVAVNKKLKELRKELRLAKKEMMQTARVKIQEANTGIVEMKQEYQRLKNEKAEAINEHLKQMRRELQLAKKEFKEAIASWRALVKGSRQLLKGASLIH